MAPALLVMGLALDGVIESAPAIASLAALVAAGVGAVVVYVTVRPASRSLLRASRALTSMAEGDRGVRVQPRGAREVALLASSLNALADRISGRIERGDEDHRMRDSILSAMEDGVLLVEGERVQYVNPAAQRLLLGAATDLRTLSLPPLRLQVDRVRGRERGEAESIEMAVPPRLLRATAMRLGTSDRVLLVLRDVTEERRVEAMRRDFVADASHELKTPAAAIRAAAETLVRAMDEDPQAARRFVRQLERETERLAAIVSDLLDLSRLETERPELRPISLDRIVRTEVERFRARAGAAGVSLSAEVGEVFVQGEEKGLTLLLDNLVDNAIRHTAPDGEVRVGVEARNGEVLLEVSDTGEGIPSRDLPRIFERFYRVDRARSRATGGTGLGLSIARHVVEQHGGRIEVDSELGRGTTFRVMLRGAAPPGERSRA